MARSVQNIPCCKRQKNLSTFHYIQSHSLYQNQMCSGSSRGLFIWYPPYMRRNRAAGVDRLNYRATNRYFMTHTTLLIDLMMAFRSCGVEPQAKVFKTFICEIAVCVRHRLHIVAATGHSHGPSGRDRTDIPHSSWSAHQLPELRLDVRPSFRAVSGLSRRQREEVIKGCRILRLAERMGLEPTHPFGLLVP